jgi:hypothetical protein
MPGTAGRIDHRNAEQCFGRVVCLGFHPVEHRVQCAIQQGLDEPVGCIVAARRLSSVPLGFITVDKGEAPPVLDQARGQFQKAFIDRAELLGLHIPPVDRHEAGFLAQPGEPENRFHKGAVRETGRLEIRHHVGGEQATQSRKSQQLFAERQGSENHRQTLPLVMMGVPGGAADGPLA